MFATVRWHRSPIDLPSKIRAYRGGLASLTVRLVVWMACLLSVIPNGVSAPALSTGEKQTSPLAADDGFTRETLMEFDTPPEPRPLAPPPTASVDESTTQDPSHLVAHRHHHRLRHPQQAAGDHPQDVVVKSSHRRNPVESFVYWWNGWVIRNFHTRNGTVLLDTIGAKT